LRYNIMLDLLRHNIGLDKTYENDSLIFTVDPHQYLQNLLGVYQSKTL
jgi:hypothetical protein